MPELELITATRKIPSGGILSGFKGNFSVLIILENKCF